MVVFVDGAFLINKILADEKAAALTVLIIIGSAVKVKIDRRIILRKKLLGINLSY